MCGKEGGGNVNVLNMIMKGIAKNENVVKLNKDKSVFVWLLYVVHEALIRRRSGGESKWHNEPFELAKLSFKSGFEGVGGVNVKLVVTECKIKC
jgi:hypothetical protein